ncbi:MAG: VanW family protein [Acidimicrobiia bacterium]|nr:VanW family protein [Acidimicrobiia bacterium]
MSRRPPSPDDIDLDVDPAAHARPATAPVPVKPAVDWRDLLTRLRGNKARMAVLVATGAVVLLVGALYTLDLIVHAGQILPGVSVGDADVGGVSDSTAQSRLTEYAAAVGNKPIPVRVENMDLDVVPAQTGLGLDARAAWDEARDVGRSGAPWTRLVRWAKARLVGREIAWTTATDRDAAVAGLDKLDFPGRIDAVEPSVTWDGLEVVITPEAIGRRITMHRAIPLLEGRLLHPGTERLELPSGIVRPRYTTADAEAAANSVAGTWLAAPVTATLLDTTLNLEPEDIAGFLRSSAGRNGFGIVVDPASMAQDVSELLPEGVGAPAVDATYTIENGAAIVLAGATGIGCCADGDAAALQEVLDETDPGQRVVHLTEAPLAPQRTDTDLAAYGPLVPLTSFTTKHPAGGDRVLNIHKLADMMRGVVVMPNASFSINDFVGPRKKADGWAEAKVIEDGVYSQSAGGGISQFATTLYNALYWAGLEIDEHTPHSIYISRYPRGREATLGYPKPDLVFTNNSPGPLLIWPSYSDSSITVELWGISDGRAVEALEQDLTRQGMCRVVTDTRVIRWPDGREVSDRYRTYYHREGYGC